MHRKQFIKTCAFACIGGSAMVTLLQGCSAIHYVTPTLDANRLVFKKSEFIEEKKNGQRQLAYVVARHDKLTFPVCVYRFSDEEYTALYLECTHRGCEVQPNDQSLVCPCHGSEFSNRGKVLSPPAEQDLRQFKVTADSENVYIHLNGQ